MFSTRIWPQSGKGVSQCLTADCLSRLEDNEEVGFDEEVVRDVAGVMYSGQSVLTFLASASRFLIVDHSCS